MRICIAYYRAMLYAEHGYEIAIACSLSVCDVDV